MPETDLSNLYEEKDVPEEKFEFVPYLKFKDRKRIANSFDSFSGSERFYWLRVEGGYKLYDDPDA